MTKEELIRCHNTAERWRILQRKMNDTRERARCAKVIRYQDEPKGRGEPISSMQSYVEKLEQLQEELKACECALHPLQCKITKEISTKLSDLRVLCVRIHVGHRECTMWFESESIAILCQEGA